MRKVALASALFLASIQAFAGPGGGIPSPIGQSNKHSQTLHGITGTDPRPPKTSIVSQ